MKQLYIILLICAFCANGKTVKPSTTTPNFVTTLTVNASNLLNNSTFPMKQSVESKPKLMVTFLANSQKDTTPYNDIEPPFFLDPFSRILQYFFASIMSDVTRPFEETDRSNISKELDDIFGTNSAELENFQNDTNKSSSSCMHGIDGFCPSCHGPPKNKNDTIVVEKKDAALYNISTVNYTTTKETRHTNHPHLQEIQIFQKPKHKRHYFLSISGDTEKRVTAPIISESKRIKRNTLNPIPKTNDNKQSFLKILEDTIYGSLNNDTIGTVEKIHTTEKLTEITEVIKLKKDTTDTTTTTESSTQTEPDNEEEEEVTERNLYDFGIYPHEAESSHGWHYFFIVTLPVTCTFSIVIFFLCIFLRTQGWCCGLFLKDPSKTLEEHGKGKGKKRRRINKKKIIVEQT